MVGQYRFTPTENCHRKDGIVAYLDSIVGTFLYVLLQLRRIDVEELEMYRPDGNPLDESAEYTAQV